MKPPSPDEFKKECREAFRYLFDYGFVELPASDPTDPFDQFVIRFESATTRIMIRGSGYDGSWTDVFFDRKGAVPKKYNPENMYNLLNLLAIRKPDFPLRNYRDIGCLRILVYSLFSRSFRLQTNQRLQIREYARALREVGTNILRGDFSVLPAVEIEDGQRHAKMLERIGARNPLSIAPQAYDRAHGSDANPKGAADRSGSKTNASAS